MQLVCPECKNDVDLSNYKDLKPEQVLECGTCGITLMTTNIEGNSVTAEVVDEGK